MNLLAYQWIHVYDTYGTDQIQTLDELFSAPRFRSLTQGFIRLLQLLVKWFTQTIPDVVFKNKIFLAFNYLSPWPNFVNYVLYLVTISIMLTLGVKLIKNVISIGS